MSLQQLLCDTTVRVGILETNNFWTGTVISTQTHPPKSYVLTVAHGVFSSGGKRPYMDRPWVVSFNGNLNTYYATLLMVRKEADMMLLQVDHIHPSGRRLRFASAEDWDLVQGQPLGAVAQTEGMNWMWQQGNVSSQSLLRNSETCEMPYDEDMVYFLHSLSLGTGCSGAAIVNMKGEIVGLHSGQNATTHRVIDAQPLIHTLDQMVADAQLRGNNPDPRAISTTLANVSFGYKDVRDLRILNSNEGHAIHVGYLNMVFRQLASLPPYLHLNEEEDLTTFLDRYFSMG